MVAADPQGAAEVGDFHRGEVAEGGEVEGMLDFQRAVVAWDGAGAGSNLEEQEAAEVVSRQGEVEVVVGPRPIDRALQAKKYPKSGRHIHHQIHHQSKRVA